MITETKYFPQNIGKSKLVRALSDDMVKEEETALEHRTFIADFFWKKIMKDNLRIKLEIW